MEIDPKSVIILTGFLGSGKTTLLNAILGSKKVTRFAIIENEVGEIGIDGELIIKNTDSFTELSSGCICCSLNNDFTETLKKLIYRNDWDELIIEATGVANPGGILTPFKQFPWVQKYFKSPVVISIVDAQNIEEQLQLSDTAASQIAYGDNVYISKKDTISNEQLISTQKLIKRLNPLAAYYAGDKNNVPVNDLLQKRKSLIPFIPAGNSFSIQEKEIHHAQFNTISRIRQSV